MKSIKVKIPAGYQDIIKKYPNIDWSEIAKNAIIETALKLELIDKIFSKSNLKEKNDGN